MALTQHEVVKKIGVSRGTLHRVLTGSALVKASTRERVLRELDHLNYVPNAIAQGLKNRKTNTLGVIGPATANLSNADKLTSIYQAARLLGYSIVFAYSDGSPEADANSIRELRSRMVDGIVAFGRGLAETAPLYEKLIKDGVPFVSLYPIERVATDCVYVDTRDAFRRLTEHLIDLGHRDIGLLLNPSRTRYIINREAGFRDAMTRAKLPINNDWITFASPAHRSGAAMDEEKANWKVSDYQYGFDGASRVLAQRTRPTALVCMTDDAAIGALRAADLAGIPVPGQLAIVGYDDKEAARFARVPLTTMHQPDEMIGQEVISLLTKRIGATRPSAKPTVHPLHARLVIRESCGMKRSGPPSSAR